MRHLLLLALLASMTGCFVRTGPPVEQRTVYRGGGACPPAHHWEGGVCVHNGRGRNR